MFFRNGQLIKHGPIIRGSTSTNGLCHRNGPLTVGSSGVRKINFVSKAVHSGNGLKPTGIFSGLGSGLNLNRNSLQWPSLKADHQQNISCFISTANNSNDLFRGRLLEGEKFFGHTGRRFLAGKLSKITPKMASTFVHGNITSGQNQIFEGDKNNRKWGSCSLQVSGCSQSPDSASKGHNHKILPSASGVCTMELDGLSNFVGNSWIHNDFDLDSDEEGLHSNMLICSSSEDEEVEDGEELDSKTSEANEA